MSSCPASLAAAREFDSPFQVAGHLASPLLTRRKSSPPSLSQLTASVPMGSCPHAYTGDSGMLVPGIAGNVTPAWKSPERPRVRVIWAFLLPASSRKYQLPGGREGGCSVAQSCPTLCDLVDSGMPGSLSFTISRTLLKFMFIELVMLFNHLILCHPLLLLPSVFPSISESALCIRWPKYWSFSFSISPSNPCYMWITMIMCDPHYG